jgi:hypothetical protein
MVPLIGKSEDLPKIYELVQLDAALGEFILYRLTKG